MEKIMMKTEYCVRELDNNNRAKHMKHLVRIW